MSETFTLAPDGIPPSEIAQRTLHTGAKMPGIGLGTFGSDRFSHEEIAKAVREAIACGYRHIDCASVYGNETHIGEVLAEVLASGEVKREELWITSKVWNDKHSEVRASCEQSIADLQVGYLDLYLTHWPFPNFHPPGCDIDSRSPHAKPYIHENFMKTWRQMEELVDAGLTKHIGTSNMTVPKMKLVLRDARIQPACNEMELHPHFQQEELFKLCIDNSIAPIGFCPIGSPTRPDRDKTEDDTVDIEDPVVGEIAKRLGVHPAVVCVAWAVQRGQTPIPFSVFRNEFLSNLNSGRGKVLSDEDIQALSKVDKNNRLIKGHVFLWKDGQDWDALWDMNGEVTPA